MASVESAFCNSPSPIRNPNPTASPIRNPNPTASPIRNPTPIASNPSRQVTEFRDTFGTFIFYKRNLEKNPNFDLNIFRHPLDDDDEDGEEAEKEEDMNHVDDPHQAIITHFRQVRESFGFDVDVVVPSWAALEFIPLDMSDPVSRKYSIEGAKIAIDGINEDLGSKSYELVEVVKAVYCRILSKYLTITAKKLDVDGVEPQLVTIQAIVLDIPGRRSELEQWRFKP